MTIPSHDGVGNTLSQNFPSRVIADNIPAELRALPRWVVWRTVVRYGQKTKIPFQINGSPASTTDPATWTAFHNVWAAYLTGGWDGVGFVFCAADGYIGIDIDHAVDENGTVSSDAQAIIRLLASYTEFSQSGRGIHIIIKAKLPPGRRRRGNVEIYSDKRYFAMTGNVVSEVSQKQQEIGKLHAQLFEKTQTTPNTNSEQIPRPYPRDLGLDDDDIIDAATREFGAKFAKLFYEGHFSEFPSHSEADFALLKMAARFTNSAKQIERIFNRSKLARDKWFNRPDYRANSIRIAIQAAEKGVG